MRGVRASRAAPPPDLAWGSGRPACTAGPRLSLRLESLETARARLAAELGILLRFATAGLIAPVAPQPRPTPARAAAAESSPPTHPDPLVADLARRLRWAGVETVAKAVGELRAEGTPEDWLRARVDATPEVRGRPFDWATEARKARPKASPVNDQERIVAARSAESHAQRYREHLAAGRTAQAASSWAQVVSFAKDAGIDPETLRHDPLAGPGRAA